MRYLTALVFLLISASDAGAQQTGQNKAPGEAEFYTLSVRSQLVISPQMISI